MHDSTVPADLLELKSRLNSWRGARKYLREPIPEEIRLAAAEMSRRYSPSLIRRHLKLDPWKQIERPDGSRLTFVLSAFDASTITALCARFLRSRYTVIQIVPQMRILLACRPVDCRCGIDGLAARCINHLVEDPFYGALFVFRNRRGAALILLNFDGGPAAHRPALSGRTRASALHARLAQPRPSGGEG